MAGKICADVVFYDDYYNDVKRKNYFLNQTTNERDKHRYYCVFNEISSLEKLGSQIRYQYKYLS
jgi:hypothetical protein